MGLAGGQNAVMLVSFWQAVFRKGCWTRWATAHLTFSPYIPIFLQALLTFIYSFKLLGESA